MTSIIVAIVGAVATLGAGLGGVVLGHILRDRRARSDADNEKGLKAKWRTEAPAGASMLRDAQDSLLLVGTSNTRVVDDDFKVYRDWLDFQEHRLIGLLFLNPSSPHAEGRDRGDVHRSAAEITKQKLVEARARHERFIPAVYDGPYRYSARAIDAGSGRKNLKPRLSVFTSSHLGGTPAGFRVDLDPVRDHEAFEHYRGELLDLWKGALSNPAGHGISIVSRGKLSLKSADPDKRDVAREAEVRLRLTQESANLLGHINGSKEVYLFSPQQFHVTISSLCRTQETPDAAALSIDSDDKVARLPQGYAEFAAEAVRTVLSKLTRQDLAISFTNLSLDQAGYIALHASEGSESPAIERFQDILRNLAELRAKYEKARPSEGWDDLLSNESSYRFEPKYSMFAPHITIGRAFTSTGPLPLVLEEEATSLALAEPIQFLGGGVSVAHYAYRSLLRCVGVAPFYFETADADEVGSIQLVRALRI